MNKDIFLLLGSNVGNSYDNLKTAIHRIQTDAGVVIKQSSIYRTKAWGKIDQPDFLNQVIQIETNLSPKELLVSVLEIEKKMGRVRNEKWGPRIIDIDILFYNQEIVNLPQLIIPHPEIAARRFTLSPLAELSPDFSHPLLNKTVVELLKTCADPLPVERL
jgi:2-amino-4-hydroxy-6-hydroxymethyldihydropteridine diphosphokinase